MPLAGGRPVRRDGAEAVPLDDNVALYDEVGQLMILLNTSAAAVWELCDGTRAPGEIGRTLAEEHGASGADADVIGEDVRLTVHKLADLGLVVDATPSELPPGGRLWRMGCVHRPPGQRREPR
jgi:coenzyme PQQ synthesis protein D (PqqD)